MWKIVFACKLLTWLVRRKGNLDELPIRWTAAVTMCDKCKWHDCYSIYCQQNRVQSPRTKRTLTTMTMMISPRVIRVLCMKLLTVSLFHSLSLSRSLVRWLVWSFHSIIVHHLLDSTRLDLKSFDPLNHCVTDARTHGHKWMAQQQHSLKKKIDNSISEQISGKRSRHATYPLRWPGRPGEEWKREIWGY